METSPLPPSERGNVGAQAGIIESQRGNVGAQNRDFVLIKVSLKCVIPPQGGG